MKIILLEDVKGKGKKDQIIEVANGYANFLISNKKAVICNQENNNALKERILEANVQYVKDVEEATKELNKCQSKVFTIEAEVTPKGTLKTSITKATVLELLALYCNIHSVKTKDLTMGIIQTPGKYKIGIKFHADVKGYFYIQVNVKN